MNTFIHCQVIQELQDQAPAESQNQAQASDADVDLYDMDFDFGEVDEAKAHDAGGEVDEVEAHDVDDVDEVKAGGEVDEVKAHDFGDVPDPYNIDKDILAIMGQPLPGNLSAGRFFLERAQAVRQNHRVICSLHKT